MARLLSIVFCLLLIALSSCDSWRGEEMRQQLSMLQQWNQADSLLTNDSLAQALADWFDCHGTPNEQLEAHYLLGRTHADRGEAPAAIAAYHDAIDRADTTATDCNYRQLAKVYGQIGELFYWQNLMDNAMWAYDNGYRSAMRSGDTLLAIVYFEHKAKCYYDMGNRDSSKVIINEARSLYLQYGDTLSANNAVEPLIYLAVEERDYEKAAVYIDLFGHHSYISSDTLRYHDLWGLFKIHTGLYYLGLDKTESAVCLFHDGLAIVDNPYGRLLAYKGLYETYRKLGVEDSIVKYAEKMIQANDSTVNTHISDQMQHLQAQYNYDRLRLKADRLTIEASHERQKATVLFLVLIALLSIILGIIAIIIIRRHRKRARRQRMRVRYTADTLLFKTFNDELKRSASQPEREKAITENIKFLEESLSRQPKDLKTEAVVESFQGCDVVALIREYGQKGKVLPEACWVSLRQAVNVYAPSFIFSIAQMNTGIDLSDTNLCMLSLIRDMPQKAKAAAMGMDYHALAMKRKRLFETLFGREGSAKYLEKALQKMAFSS